MKIVGLTGGTGQGKSTFGKMLRDLAGVDSKADLEFSYPISEVANEWMKNWPQIIEHSGNRSVTELANELIQTYPEVLKRLANESTTFEVLKVSDEESSQRMHAKLLEYLSNWTALSPGERAKQLPTPISPENKGIHRKVLQWVGGVTVELVDAQTWSNLIVRRIKQLDQRGYGLVTVGGVRFTEDAAAIRNCGGVIVRVIRPETALVSDVTERSAAEVSEDSQVINNGTLDELQVVAQDIYADLKSGSVKPQYLASD